MLQANLVVAPNGRVLIPAGMRAALGWHGGSRILARLVDGAVILEPVDAAIARAQAMVSRYVPQNSGLVDDLISERKRAAADE